MTSTTRLWSSGTSESPTASSLIFILSTVGFQLVFNLKMIAGIYHWHSRFTLLAIEALSYAGKSVSNSELGMRTTCSGANCQIGSLPRAESREVRKQRETLGKAAFSSLWHRCCITHWRLGPPATLTERFRRLKSVFGRCETVGPDGSVRVGRVPKLKQQSSSRVRSDRCSWCPMVWSASQVSEAWLVDFWQFAKRIAAEVWSQSRSNWRS